MSRINQESFLRKENTYVKKRNKSNLPIVILTVFLFVLTIFTMMFDVKRLSFIDDFIAVLLIAIIFIKSIINRSYIPYIFGLLILLLIDGFIGYFISGIDRPFILLFQDFFLNFKWVFFLLGINILIFDYLDEKNRLIIKKIFFYIVVIFLISMAIVNSYQMFALHYAKPTFFSNFNGNIGYLSFCSFIFLYSYLKNNRKKKNNALVFICLALSIYNCLISKSSLSIGLLISFILFIFAKGFIKKNKIFTLLLCAFSLGLFVLFNQSKIESYFFDNTTPRGALLYYAIKYSLNNFPFGIGLSLYGTATSVSNYSPIYYETGIAYIDGCGPVNTAYLLDSYLSALIGEFGFLGILLFLLLSYFVFKEIFTGKKIDASCLFIFLFFLSSITLFNFSNSIQFVSLLHLLLISCNTKNNTDKLEECEINK